MPDSLRPPGIPLPLPLHHFLREHDPPAFDIRHDRCPTLELPLQQRQRQRIRNAPNRALDRPCAKRWVVALLGQVRLGRQSTAVASRGRPTGGAAGAVEYHDLHTCSRRQAWKMTMSSTRFRNSGRK